MRDRKSQPASPDRHLNHWVHSITIERDLDLAPASRQPKNYRFVRCSEAIIPTGMINCLRQVSCQMPGKGAPIA